MSAGTAKPNQVKIRLTRRASAALYNKRRRVATALGFLLVMFLGYYVAFGPNGVNNYEQKRAQNTELEKRIQTLEQQNQQLKQHNAELRSDPDAIEFEARQKLHYVKPGEVIYKLNQPPADDGAPASSQSSKP